jgi:tetratricopeptide (TPR) repeat protein
LAAGYLMKAASLNPKDGQIHCELGLMLYRQKKNRDAKTELEKAIKLQGDKGRAYYYLGKIQKDARDFTGAAASFEQAARDQRFKIRALVERGISFMALNAPDKAAPDLERAVNAITDETAQDSLYARYFLGLCYESAGEMDKAIAQWEKIYARKQNFRDVGEKLARYQDIRSDDNMKDYLTSSPQEFLELCGALTSQALSLSVQTAKNLGDACEIIAIENESAKWRNTRKMPRLLRFFRGPEPVDEPEIRALLDEAKNQNVTRTAALTSAGFSRAALDYATSRPVELFDREKLQEILHNVRAAEPQTARRS